MDQQKLINATNLICEHVRDNLPAGWEVAFILNTEEAYMTLYDPEGNEIEYRTDKDISCVEEICRTATDIEKSKSPKFEHKYLCEKCGGHGCFLGACCSDCHGVGYLGFREVKLSEFTETISMNGHHATFPNQYPWTSQYLTKDNLVIGAHVKSVNTYWLQ